MTSGIISGKRENPWGPLLAVFIKLILLSPLLLFTFKGSAHSVVLSEYRLEYKEDGWMLSFQQKTGQLRDAIYSIRPDLKGTNLNSEIFLEETTRYITNTFTLKYDGKFLKIVPTYMRYGGLKFEAQFLLKGLPKHPEYLAIKSSGFDRHEHSINLLSITIGEHGYVNYFNRNRDFAVFSFDSKQYTFSEVKTSGGYQALIYIAGLLIILIIIDRALPVINIQELKLTKWMKKAGNKC